jgi:hypothetical protein
MSDEDDVIAEILDLNEQLLDAIMAADWDSYEKLCDPTLTAFEPESRGCLAEGLEFHRYYFDRGGLAGPYNISVCGPHVRVMDNVAVVSYVRLLQCLDAAGKPQTFRSEETRVWQRQSDGWRHVHFHRSIG